MISARAYLEQVRSMNLIIQTYEDELDMLMTRLTSTTSKPKDVNVMSSREDTLPDDIEKLIELKKKISENLNRFAKQRIEADAIINQIPDYRYQSVLIKYYFQNKTLEQVAVEMDKSYQWTCELRDRALVEFGKILKKN